ncbi:hypothetical protein NQ315_000854 [Exocentrus adspersus]|uniref:MSP domain-containing protein n=1 Tax=Exocentrus adspersus TaxID=1586481 RepID=A0AAV8WDX1_9CUCU|nr:hypothetical protein NQ315_000854 [Exocentrus adspersus]
MSLNIKKIPVFVFPNTLKFYLGSKASYKQLLTLYNPYDVPVKFKVLCTAPNKYTVIDPEGSIGPHTVVDIIIRHTAPISSNCHARDKFRIVMEDHATRQVLGKREVEAILLHDERDDLSNDGDFHSLPFTERSSVIDDRRTFTNRLQPPVHQSNYLILIVIGLVSAGSLLLPYQNEKPESSFVPWFLYVPINFKLSMAYVLGAVSMLIFRP